LLTLSGPAAVSGRCVPPELVAVLVQEDDWEVRCALAELLPGLGAATAQLAACHEAKAGELAVTLLDAAFALVEDDVEAVVGAAEAALPALAGLTQPLTDPATAAAALAEPLARLAASEEEEVRTSAARLAGSLAAPLGMLLADAHLLPLALCAAGDPSFRVRKAACAALAELAPVCGRGAASARLLPALLALSADAVWTVRKAATDVLVPACVAAADSPAAAAAALATAFARLCSDAGPGPWVRHAAMGSLGQALQAMQAGGQVALLLPLLRAHYREAAACDDTAEAVASGFADTAVALGCGMWEECRDAFDALRQQPDRQVRRLLAAGLPRLARMLGPERAARQLAQPFADAAGDAAPEVAAAAVEASLDFALALHLHVRASVLVPALRAAAAAPPAPAGGAPERRACGGWRARCAAAEAMSALAHQAHALFCADPPLDGEQDDAAGAAEAVERLLPCALAATRDPVAAVRASAAGATAALLAACVRGGVGSQGRVVGEACGALRVAAASGDYLQRLTFVRTCAALALLAADHSARLGTAAATLLQRELSPLLLSLIDDPVPAVRSALALALAAGTIRWAGDSELRDARRRLAADADAETRRCASLAIAAHQAAAAHAAPHAQHKLPSSVAAKHPPKLGLLQRRALEGTTPSFAAAPASSAPPQKLAPLQPHLQHPAPAPLPEVHARAHSPPWECEGTAVGSPQARSPPIDMVKRAAVPRLKDRPAPRPGLLQRRAGGGESAIGAVHAATASLQHASLGSPPDWARAA